MSSGPFLLFCVGVPLETIDSVTQTLLAKSVVWFAFAAIGSVTQTLPKQPVVRDSQTVPRTVQQSLYTTQTVEESCGCGLRQCNKGAWVSAVLLDKQLSLYACILCAGTD